MADHLSFTPGATSYLRNLNAQDMHADAFAVHFQEPPRREGEYTSIGLRFPMLLVSVYFANQEEIAAKVSRILEKHWDDPEDHPQGAAAEQSELDRRLKVIWVDFLDANPDNVSSPQEYPDHALVTFDQVLQMFHSALEPGNG